MPRIEQVGFSMEIKIDDYGRIVIPKNVRDRLGISSGSTLEVEVRSEGEAGESITLKPKGQEPPLQKKGELLVHSGRLLDEDFDVVEQIRTGRRDRAQKHAGLDK
jgi:AbrB family looped-hinge helix DNA binding protein